MNVENAALKHLFENQSLEFMSALKPDYFQRGLSKTIFKLLQKYVGTFHKIPSKEIFKAKLLSKLPEDKIDIYIGFIDGLETVDYDATPEELLEALKDNYIVNVVDNNIEELVHAGKEKDVDKIKTLIHKLDSLIAVEEKTPDDMLTVSYTPSKIKLIDPFLPTMKKYGLQFGGLTLIAGGSGGGKSIFVLQQLMYSYEQGYNVCLLNLELGLDETIARMYSIATNTPFNDVYGNHEPEVVKKIDEWRKTYFDRKNKFYIKNTSFDTTEIEAIVRAMTKRGVNIFGVDYLNLVEINTEEEWKGLSKMVKRLHRLSQELSLVILTPTQVNLTDTKEKDGELKVTTRGSRELEFSATVFLFIYQTKEEYSSNTARIFTIKARNAQKKTYIVETDFAHMKFKDTGMVL